MKGRRILSIAFCIIVGACLILAAGCGGGGGNKTQGITSPYRGSLAGVETQPADQETNIATDSWVRVYWPNDGLPPPALFTVRMEKEQSPDVWGAIHTVLDANSSDAFNGSWWFKPTSLFSPNTWYRVIITVDANHQVMAYFQTAPAIVGAARALDAGVNAGKKYRPAGAENAPLTGEPGSVDHVIAARK